MFELESEVLLSILGTVHMVEHTPVISPILEPRDVRL